MSDILRAKRGAALLVGSIDWTSICCLLSLPPFFFLYSMGASIDRLNVFIPDTWGSFSIPKRGRWIALGRAEESEIGAGILVNVKRGSTGKARRRAARRFYSQHKGQRKKSFAMQKSTADGLNGGRYESRRARDTPT